jgi:hypothetical protein
LRYVALCFFYSTACVAAGAAASLRLQVAPPAAGSSQGSSRAGLSAAAAAAAKLARARNRKAAIASGALTNTVQAALRALQVGTRIASAHFWLSACLLRSTAVSDRCKRVRCSGKLFRFRYTAMVSVVEHCTIGVVPAASCSSSAQEVRSPTPRQVQVNIRDIVVMLRRQPLAGCV